MMKGLTRAEKDLLLVFADILASDRPEEILGYRELGGLDEFARIVREKIAPPAANEERTRDLRIARRLVEWGHAPRKAARLARIATVKRPLNDKPPGDPDSDPDRVDYLAREVSRRKAR